MTLPVDIAAAVSARLFGCVGMGVVEGIATIRLVTLEDKAWLS